MLEFVKEDRLPAVVDKINIIYQKHYGNKTDFIEYWINKYKDKKMVYNNEFYKENPDYMKADAMFILLNRTDKVGSITSGERDLEVIDIKEYSNN